MNMFYVEKDFQFEQMPDINIYIEKVHIFEKGQAQQILLVIFKS